jgi:hypothetical protein
LAIKEGKTRVEIGTLDRIVEAVEKELELSPGSLKREKVKTRTKQNNPTGKSRHGTTPLEDMEELLVQWIIRLALMNEPLNREGIMSLADDIIRGTPYEEYLCPFIAERGHKMKNSSIVLKQRDGIVWYGWYRAFLVRHADRLTRKKGKIRDCNRRTWCTIKHFFICSR